MLYKNHGSKKFHTLPKISIFLTLFLILLVTTGCMSISQIEENIDMPPFYQNTDEYEAGNNETTLNSSKESTEEIKMTTEQKNALRSAKTYLSYMSFSYEGLIQQLEFEQYSHESAVFAADNCGADWNNQALKKAKSYLDYSAFSYEGLINQLEFEKYTTEQATYAADNCGADWNEQAAKAAKSYLDFSSFSKDGLIRQLEFAGFTEEQALYGAEQNGY